MKKDNLLFVINLGSKIFAICVFLQAILEFLSGIPLLSALKILQLALFSIILSAITLVRVHVESSPRLRKVSFSKKRLLVASLYMITGLACSYAFHWVHDNQWGYVLTLMSQAT